MYLEKILRHNLRKEKYLHIIFQGDMVYNMQAYGTGTHIFGINNSSGEVSVRDAALLRSDRAVEYLVRATYAYICRPSLLLLIWFLNTL